MTGLSLKERAVLTSHWFTKLGVGREPRLRGTVLIIVVSAHVHGEAWRIVDGNQYASEVLRVQVF